MERRLAVILAADVVGYSRLMEADEEGTLAQIRSHREELVNPTITEHHWPASQVGWRRCVGRVQQRRRCRTLCNKFARGNGKSHSGSS